MVANPDHVGLILGNKITVCCADPIRKKFLKSLGFRRNFFYGFDWYRDCGDESTLAQVMQKLNDFGFMFSGGYAGWNPSEIYQYMRNKKLVSGRITEICWIGEGKTETRIL